MDRSPERDSDRPRNGKLDRDRHENPRERIPINHTYNKRLVSKIYEKLSNSIIRKKNPV